MESDPVKPIRFGEDFELDVESYLLRRSGRVLKLERIPMEILLLFLDQRGRLVSREQIVDRIWGKTVFLDTDNSINAAIRKLRQALKDDPEKPRFIETVTGKGYRFIAPVETGGGTEANAVSVASAPQAVEDEPRAVAELGSVFSAHRRRQFVLGLAAILIAVAGVGIRWSHFPARSHSNHGRPMLAILPFTNLTGDPAQDYFSDGLTEEMISQLGNLDPQHLGVIARTSVMHYKNTQTPLRQISRELGVQYVLEGSVRRDSQRVRITAQLIQVSDQSHLWAREYDRELAGLLALQGEVTREIASEIRETLGAGPGTDAARDGRAVLAAASSYEAYDLYLKGRYFWNKRTLEGFRRAAQYFQQAVDKDPNYARAYAGLADTFGLMSTWYLVPQNEFMPKARAAASRALQIDDSLAEAHASLALIAENYDYDWPTAEKEFQRAIQLNPQYATGHQWYAECLAWQGRFDEAFAESEQARQLDPMSLIIAADHGMILYYSRQYDRAIEQSRAVLDMDPSFSHARAYLALSYVQQHKFGDALDEIHHWRSPEDWPWMWAMSAYVYGQSGRAGDARRAFDKFERSMPISQAGRTAGALFAYAGTKRNEQVIQLLQTAYSEHSNAVVQIKVDPMYDPLRSDPRFQELLRRLGLSE